MTGNDGIDIGIVTRPASGSSYAEPIHRFVSILQPSASSLTLFAGPDVTGGSELPEENLIEIEWREYSGFTPLDYFLLQVEVALNIFLVRNEFDLLYFHKGAMAFALPVLVSRLTGINTCVIKIGAFNNQRSQGDTPDILTELITRLQYWSFKLADAAVVFTESERTSVPNETVFVAFSNYRDFEEFDIFTPFQKREIDIGFLGRFHETKGIIEFAKATQELTNQCPDIQVRLLGDGPEFKSIEQTFQDNTQVELIGWVDRSDIPLELNKIKILVVPSKAEGLPTTILEAMGCGVVVIATRVGSIPDLINDGKTGFLLDSNSSRSIKKKMKEISESDNLETIAGNGRELVRSKYSLENCQINFEYISREMIQ